MAKRKAAAKSKSKSKAKSKPKTKSTIYKSFTKDGLTLYDDQGRMRILFYVASDGCPQIALYGDDGCERLVLGVQRDNTPCINLRNADRESAGVALDTDGNLHVGIRSEKCFPYYKEEIHPSGERLCEAVDAEGRITFLRRTPTSGAEIVSGTPEVLRRKAKRDK